MATIVGILASLVLFGIALYNQGGVKVFFDINSIIIVIGGIVASTLIAHPLPQIFKIFQVFKKAFLKEADAASVIIFDVLKCSIKARRESFLALEELLDTLENDILNQGVRLLVDGYNKESIKDILELEIQNKMDRHNRGEALFRFMGKVAPAFGMIGTLIGLIAMLRSLGISSPSGLGPAMATALITTFYGAMLSNLLFNPIAEKLAALSENEYIESKIALEGVLMIYDGVNPRIIEKKLNSFLPKNLRQEMLSRVKNER